MTPGRFSKDTLEECGKVLDGCILPCFDLGNERPLEKDDFVEAKRSFLLSARLIYHLFSEGLCGESESSLTVLQAPDLLVSLLIHLSQHHRTSEWTCDETIQVCKMTKEVVFQTGSDEYFLSLLSDDRGKLLKKFLLRLSVCLCGEEWRKRPTAIQSYEWCLGLTAESPAVATHLDLMLPPALLTADDFVLANKERGVRCLSLIVSAVPGSVLKHRCHDDVIYNTLESCLHSKHPHLISLTVSTLRALLDKTQLFSPDRFSVWTHYDDLITKYLYLMRIESDVLVKESLMDNLTVILEGLGVCSVRHISSVLRAVEDYSSERCALLPSIRVILGLTRTSGPDLHPYLDQIAFIVFKILFLCQSLSNATAVESACRSALVRVSHLEPEILRDLAGDVRFHELRPHIKALVQEIVIKT